MNIAQSISVWRETRKTARELAKLSDRSLNDLGIERANIHSAAKRAVRNGSFFE
ncbi:MAG: DUF1127 domain-containing protein [Ahrensia sp.]|nr:DUF1127 domain-containing protein [Ahrensia sp.]